MLVYELAVKLVAQGAFNLPAMTQMTLVKCFTVFVEDRSFCYLGPKGTPETILVGRIPILTYTNDHRRGVPGSQIALRIGVATIKTFVARLICRKPGRESETGVKPEDGRNPAEVAMCLNSKPINYGIHHLILMPDQ